MNLEQFRQWAIGQGSVGNPTADPNNAFLGECVSLIQQYLNKVHGIAWVPRGDAKDWGTNSNVLSYFDRVSSPQAGDIGVSGATPTNRFGHIWIYTSPTTILEQNGRVRRRVSTGQAYSNPIAILRRKGTPQQGDIDMIGSGENWYNRLNKLHVQLLGVEFPRKDFPYWVGKPLLNFVEAVSDNPAASTRGNVATVAMRDNWEGQIRTLQKQFADATKVANDLQARLVASENTTKALTEKVDKLNAKVAELDNPDNIVVSRGFFNSLFDKLKNLIGGSK